MRVVPTKYGALFYEGRTVLSKTLARPGPVDDLYDVLACCAALLSSGRPVALLGFAGGGILGPLRAAGCEAPVRAVDLSRAGERGFRRLSSGWCGEVRLDRAEAADWLRRVRSRFDLIVEDLTVNDAGGATKPPVSLGPLPGLMRRRLAPGGFVLINALPVRGLRWREILRRIAAPFPCALRIDFTEFENRLVVAGRDLPGAASLSRRIAASLRTIGSRMVARYSVRTMKGA